MRTSLLFCLRLRGKNSNWKSEARGKGAYVVAKPTERAEWGEEVPIAEIIRRALDAYLT